MSTDQKRSGLMRMELIPNTMESLDKERPPDKRTAT